MRYIDLALKMLNHEAVDIMDSLCPSQLDVKIKYGCHIDKDGNKVSCHSCWHRKIEEELEVK